MAKIVQFFTGLKRLFVLSLHVVSFMIFLLNQIDFSNHGLRTGIILQRLLLKRLVLVESDERCLFENLGMKFLDTYIHLDIHKCGGVPRARV